MKNILGEYSSFFKPSTYNYVHVNFKKNVYRNAGIETTVNQHSYLPLVVTRIELIPKLNQVLIVT